MHTYTSTYTNLLRQDLKDSILPLLMILVPVVLGIYLDEWRAIRDSFAYRAVMTVSIIALLKQIFLERRVWQVSIDETNRKIIIYYWMFARKHQASFSFKAGNVTIAKKKLLGFRAAQWASFEDRLADREYRVEERKNGFSSEVVRRLIRDIEVLTHPKA